MNKSDFIESTVVDLGCNTGHMSCQARIWGASKVTGIDYNLKAIEKANENKEKLDLDNIKFIVDDLDSNFLWTSLPNFDVVLFSSFNKIFMAESYDGTPNARRDNPTKNKHGILSKACMKTNKVMYFEGHIKNIINYTDFTEIKYLDQNSLRCTRKKLTSEEAAQVILNSPYNKIVVVGKSQSGKSHIRKLFAPLNNGKYTIIDEHVIWSEKLRIEKMLGRQLPTTHKEGTNPPVIENTDISKIDKFVLFDYRGLEYCKDADVVIYVHTNEDLFGQLSWKKHHNISTSIQNFDSIKEVYTVESY